MNNDGIIASNDGIIARNFTEKEKDKLISEQIEKLTAICDVIEEDRIATVRNLIEEAAFMAITLLDLRKTINKEGVTSVYQNGANQWGTKKSPEIEVYNILIKNYIAVMKQINDSMPKTEAMGNSEIMEFIGIKK